MEAIADFYFCEYNRERIMRKVITWEYVNINVLKDNLNKPIRKLSLTQPKALIIFYILIG